ncbi:MAG: oxygenase MpaB family protein [Sandaracinaceae bacterium]
MSESSVLDAARGEGDPLADACVDALGARAFAVNALLRHGHRNDDPLPSALPAEVRDLFLQVTLPEWTEASRITAAQRWAAENIFLVTAALFAASLPSTYAAAKGARVLAATGRMGPAELVRRVNETAQFVLDVLTPGAFGPEGAGLSSIRKVRLIHASVRRRLARDPAYGDETPINQEDLVGTSLAFSVTVLDAVRALGGRVEDGVADDFVHLWRVVSTMLGARDDLLPRSVADAIARRRSIATRQNRASEHGRSLMAALLAGMEAHTPGLRDLPRLLVRYLVGDALAELLGVPRATSPLSSIATLVLRSGRPSGAIVPGLSLVGPRFGKPLLEAVVAKKLSGATASFELPR